MRFTKRMAGLATMLFVASCTELGSSDSRLSGDDDGQASDCTRTQGYWKNHPAAWPVSSLELGTVTYDKDALIAILKTPVMGNGLIQLAHQLIAAKLNVEAGADDTSIEASIDAADALIGDLVVGEDSLRTSATSELNGELDAFNKGDGNTCEDEPPAPVCGNGVVEGDEECDDGNTTSGDGCSSVCVCDCPT